MSTVRDEILRWSNPPFDQETIRSMELLSEEELTDAFSARLQFGTGGLRAKMGPGINRINRYTVAAATKGLMSFYREQLGRAPGIVIGYDTRNNSEQYAKTAAAVAAAAGGQVLLFPSHCPVPVLAFAVRTSGCDCGVMITASHNPPAYNGYKVFTAEGGQVVPPKDSQIAAVINAVPVEPFSVPELQEFVTKGSVRFITKELYELYYARIGGLLPDASSEDKSCPIVYTPLHGAGADPVRQLFQLHGFSGVIYHTEQFIADGDFPTVSSPNPEEPEALEPAIGLAGETGAEAVLATDPDADRTGVVVRDLNGQLVRLNGHQAAAVLAEYLFSRFNETGQLPDRPALITTVVTTGILDRIAAFYGAECRRTLTGYKYIGELMGRFAAAGAMGCESVPSVVFTCEESCGYLTDDYIRDKDGVAAVLLFAEMVNTLSVRGSSVYRFLLELYQREGLFCEKPFSVTLEGQQGAEKIAALMQKVRMMNNDEIVDMLNAYATGEFRPAALAGKFDYLETGSPVFPPGGSDCNSLMADCLPPSDVLKLVFTDGVQLFLRPSGTEPKIKFYFSCHSSREKYKDRSLAEIEKDLLVMENTLEAHAGIWRQVAAAV